MRRWRLLFAVVVAVIAWGCRCSDPEATSPANGTLSMPSGSVFAPSMQPERLPPLEAESWLVELPTDGFLPPSVSVPVGATEPRPVLVALHGMADRPEWQCGTWRGISDGYPFIVCPRGSKHPSAPKAAETFTFTSIDAAAREVRAALKSLKARFGPYVASGKVVFAGYSLGANFGAFIVKQEPAFFARVAFIEGDARRWSASNAAIFARGGGERVLFVCAQASCVSGYEQAAALTERAGAEARFVDAKVGAHVFDGRVAAGLKKQFDWLVAGDKRWQSRGERR